ncbi:ParB/RepB/Spo0J family partition protein [Desulfitobacterium metallireducens]|uniref:Chromosome partitioning protein ParB n=1 Tax=Desulfitobacterium metallireducens DSM 15288 TaxID=871968 RepID=W0EBU8_9FIRM|nr:ParB/RepB/Spo0J family partition protein [Desulfitobacterium metallireducens]AHF08345.1 chromosome partitioning protein ParB [Desulfitobacterium metallireducens DSM 15288]
MSKKALGRGLSALISEDPILTDTGVRQISMDKISPNPDQPRKDFDSESLIELADSIRIHGLLQPILVKPAGDNYLIVAGERRFRAAQSIEMEEIPCIVHECSEQEMAERALVENIQRSDLSPVEEGLAYARLMQEYGLTQEQIAVRVGKARTTVTNLLRVIQLPERILQLIREEKLSLGHAKVLLGIKDSSLQVLCAEKAARESISVRDLELLLFKMTDSPKTVHENKKSVNLFAPVEDKLRSSFQTKVRLKGDSNRGKIEIEFFSEEELNRLLELWHIEIE